MNILITGGTGFLGKRCAFLLQERGHTVSVIGRSTEIGRELLRRGIAFFPGDLRNPDELEPAFRQIDMVIHSAALSAPWGNRRDFESINCGGTAAVLELSRRFGVSRFIHISSPSVYFDGSDRFDIKESDPTARKAPSEYTRSKLMAESLVLAAHRDGLPVIILRPRGLFGPGDTSIIPRLIAAHKKGKLRIIGDGKNRADLTYIDNAAEAVRCALEAPDSACGGIYNITGGEPVPVWGFIASLLTDMGYEPPTRKIPYALILPAVRLAELFCRTVPALGEPMLTAYTAGLLAKSQTLDISKAEKLLNYHPPVTMADAVSRTAQWFKEREFHA